jgi:uncharacterized membrane protein
MHRLPYASGHERDFLDWFFPILMLALLAALVVVVIWAFRRRPVVAGNGDPLRRAAGRYAAGEIERVEFERIQQDLARAAVTTPLEDASLRLARGEMTTAEFDTIKERLEGDEDAD